jgi:hypothetical protein
MRKNDGTQDEFTGQKLPGTGGDYIDENDVEGHTRKMPSATGDGGPEDYRKQPSATGDGGPEDYRKQPSATGDDVEGHTRKMPSATGDGGPEDYRKQPSATDDDVEGHLYRGGPTTQGEVIRRGPGENPHGER